MPLLTTGAGAYPAIGGGAPPVLSFIGTVILGTSGATVTSATVNIGNPAYIATRRVIVSLSQAGSANSPVLSATINGVSATLHITQEATQSVVIFSAIVTSGTTNVTVTVTYNGTQFQQAAGGVYNVDNSLLISGTPTTGVGDNAGSITSLATGSISTSAGGFIIGSCKIGGGSTGLAASGYTTDGFGGTSADLVFSQSSLAGGSLTPTASWGTAQTGATIGAAAWR